MLPPHHPHHDYDDDYDDDDDDDDYDDDDDEDYDDDYDNYRHRRPYRRHLYRHHPHGDEINFLQHDILEHERDVMAQLEHRAALTQQVLHNGIAEERFRQAADYNLNTHALVDKLSDYNHDQNQEMMAKLDMLHDHPYHETSHTNLDIGPAIPNHLPFHGTADGINPGYSFQSYSHTIPFHPNLAGATNSYEYHNEIPPFQHSLSEVTPGYNLNEYGDVPGFPQQSGPDHVDHEAALHEQLHNTEVMMHAEMHDPVNAVNGEPVEEAGSGHSDVPAPPRLHSPNILRDIDFNGADPVSIADHATYSLSPLARQIANAATQSTASHLASRFSAMDDKLMNLVNRPHLFEGDPKAAIGEVRSHKRHHSKHSTKQHHGHRSSNDNVQSGSARFHVPQYYQTFHRLYPSYQNLDDYDPRKDTVFDKTIAANTDTHATDFIHADNEASYQNDKHFGDMIDLAKKLKMITKSNVTNSTVEDNEHVTMDSVNDQPSSQILDKANSSQQWRENNVNEAWSQNKTSIENPNTRDISKENGTSSIGNQSSTPEEIDSSSGMNSDEKKKAERESQAESGTRYTGSSSMNQTNVDKENEEDEEASSSSSGENEVSNTSKFTNDLKTNVNKTTEPTRRHFEAITEKLNETIEFEVIEEDQPTTVKTKTFHQHHSSPTQNSQIPSIKRGLDSSGLMTHNSHNSPPSGFVARNIYSSPSTNNYGNSPTPSPYSNKRTEIVPTKNKEVKSIHNALNEIDNVIGVLKYKPTMTRSTIIASKTRKNTTLNNDGSTVSIKDVALTNNPDNLIDLPSVSTQTNDTQALNSRADEKITATNQTIKRHGFKLPDQDHDDKQTDIMKENDDVKESKEQKPVVESYQDQANKISNETDHADTTNSSKNVTVNELQSRTPKKMTTNLAAVSKKDEKKKKSSNSNSKDSITLDKNNKVSYHFNGRDHSISLDIQKKYLNYKNMVKRLREQSRSIDSLGPIEPSSLTVSLKNDLASNKSVDPAKPESQHTNSDTRSSKAKDDNPGKIAISMRIIGTSAPGKKFPTNPVPASNNTALFDDSQVDISKDNPPASSTNSNIENNKYGNDREHKDGKNTYLKSVASSITPRGNASSPSHASLTSTNKTLKHSSSTTPIGSPIQQEIDDLKNEIKLRYVKYKKLRKKFHNQTKSSIKIQPTSPSVEDDEEKMMVNSTLTLDSIIKEQSKATTGLSGNFTLVDSSSDVKKFVGKPAPIRDNTVGSVFDDNGNFLKRTIINKGQHRV